MPKLLKTPSILKNPIYLLLMVFLVAFVGGVSGFRVGRLNLTGGTNTVFVSGENGSVADVVETVSASVVSINVGTVQTVSSFFFGNQEFEVSGAGSGFIVSSDGIIVTNKHVVDEDTTSITVIDSQGNEYENVELIGTDPFNDVAFLKIKGAANLVAAKLGDSDDMRAGDDVIAIGNALGIYENTVTKGIISGLSRPVTNISSGSAETESLFDLFQTDASINQGNSGGPLINLNGEVVGINTAVAGSAENIGFAIPINDIKIPLDSIIRTGKLERPYVGISYVTIDKEIAESLDLPVDQGILIDGNLGQTVIRKDGPADKAGLERGDIIKAVNGTEIDDKHPFTSLINDFPVGETVSFDVLRDSENLRINVTLEAVPDDL